MKTLLTFLLALCTTFLFAQQRTIELDVTGIATQLSHAPQNELANIRASNFEMQLPYDGTTSKTFRVIENNVLSKKLKNQYPDLKTYSVQMVDNPSVTGDVTISPYGFYAHYLENGNIIGIRPVDMNNPVVHEVEIGFTPSDPNQVIEHASCGATDESLEIDRKILKDQYGLYSAENRSGTGSYVDAGTGEVLKRKYDLIIAATGEFTQANGGTMASAMAVITSSVQCVNSIFEKDMAICLVVVETCIFTDPNTDPFIPENSDSPNDQGGAGRTDQAADAVAQCALDNGGTSYDIGHVFHTHDFEDEASVDDDGWSTGGVAGLGVVCRETPDGTIGVRKGAGWSGSFSNTSNGWCQLATHEFGHMFGANHTFNGTGSNCTGAIAGGNSYEIASGTTIMSYQGICGADWNIPGDGVQNNYFHAASIDEMTAYANSQSCQDDCVTGNMPPVSTADPCGSGPISIPTGTPFKLIGEGTDADGDALLYSWEQLDEDGAGTPTQGATLTQTSTINGLTAGNDPLAPLFQSFPPTSDPCRYFPSFNDYKANINTIGTEFEVLPQVARTMNFALTVRDCNVAGGGTSCTTRTVNVVAGGPLVVNSPCGGGDLNAGDNLNITWNTNGSDAACTNVDVLMSTDGGCTFPYNLSNTTYSAGTAAVTIPSGVPCTNTARFQVVCADNPCATFFAMTDADCTINSTCKAVITEIDPTDELCLNEGDPGLNMTLTNNFGTDITAVGFAGTIDGTEPQTSLMYIDCQSTTPTCTVSGNDPYYDVYEFTPSMSGAHTLNMSSSNFGIVMNLYEIPYTLASCTDLLLTTANRDEGTCPGIGNLDVDNSATLNLTAGTSYALVVTSFSTGFPSLPTTYTVSFTPPAGGAIFDGVINPTGYLYTYVAVDQSTGNVVAVDAGADFSTLTDGCYDIYGANYDPATPTDPASFITQSISDILGGGDCVAFSSNSRKLVVKGACNVTDLGLVVSACNNNTTNADPSDDTYTVTINPTGSGLGANFTLAGAPATTGSGNGTYGYGSTVLGPFNISDGNWTATVTDASGAPCQLTAAVTAPATCSNNCVLTITENTQLACNNNGTDNDTSDDFYTITFNATVVNGGGANTFEVVQGANVDGTGGTVLGSSTFGTATAVGAGMELAADGTTTYTITVRDQDDLTCFATYTTTVVAACSTPVCTLTDLGVTVGTCQDNGTPTDPSDDIYEVIINPMGSVLGASGYDVTGAPATTGNGNTNYAYGATTLGPFNISDGNWTLTVTDTDTGVACQLTAAITAPATCSSDCALTITENTQLACSDNGTPTDTSDDFYTITFNATSVNGGGANTFEIVTGANPDGTGGTVVGSSAYGTATTVGAGMEFAADGATTYTITVRDMDDPTCFATYTTTVVNTCLSCSVNITGGPYGPYCILEESVTLTSDVPGGTWSGFGIVDAAAGTFSPYEATIVGGAVDQVVTYTVTDASGCTASDQIIISIIECAADFVISDPCQCLDNSTPIDVDNATGGGDGQFAEIVTVSGATSGITMGPGQLWAVIGVVGATDAYNVPSSGQSAGVPIPADGSILLTYDATNNVYTMPFVHTEGVGYVLTIEGPFGDTDGFGIYTQVLEVSNICDYPEPVIDQTLDTYCGGDPIVNLTGSEINGAAGSGVFTLDGDPTAITSFDPATLSTGSHQVTYTYTATDDGNVGVSPDAQLTPATIPAVQEAHPVCVQEVVDMFTVGEGPAIVLSASATTVCFGGGNVQLMANATGGVSGVWSGDTAPLSDVNIPNPVLDATTAGVYNLTYTAMDAAGCSSSENIMITVSSSPAVSITPVADICEDSAIVPVIVSPAISGAGGTGILSGPGINAVAGTFDPVAAGPGNHFVNYIFTTDSGCVGIDQITIVVEEIPTVEAGNALSICPQGTVDLSSIGANVAGAATGTWSSSGDGVFDSTDFATGTSYTPSATDISNGSFTLTLTSETPDAGFCGAGSDTVEILIRALNCGNFPWDGSND